MAINLPFPVAPSAPLLGPSGQVFTAAASDIRLRADLLPGCVAIKFRIVSTVNGLQQISVINDIATTISSATVEGIGYDGGLCPVATFLTAPATYLAGGTQTTLQNAALAPGVKAATINMEGGNQNLCVFNTIPVSTGDPASVPYALAMWQFLVPALATATGIAKVSGSSVTATDDFGNTLDLSKYAYILLDNAIPTWLQAYAPYPAAGPVVKQATITGQLSYSEVATTASGAVTTKVVNHQEFSAHATLIQIGGGSGSPPWASAYAEYTASEVIPYGLAGYIYNIENIPQYEGSYSIQEEEITDMCPVGSALNLTGSANPAWAAMKAQVQSVHYDIKTGRTDLRFGPAPISAPKTSSISTAPIAARAPSTSSAATWPTRPAPAAPAPATTPSAPPAKAPTKTARPSSTPAWPTATLTPPITPRACPASPRTYGAPASPITATSAASAPRPPPPSICKPGPAALMAVASASAPATPMADKSGSTRCPSATILATAPAPSPATLCSSAANPTTPAAAPLADEPNERPET